MKPEVLDMLADIPSAAERVVVMYPTPDGQWAVRWVGLTPEQVASYPYQMADATVDQRIPPREAWRPK